MVASASNQADQGKETFVFPASFAQQRLWLLEQLLPKNTLYTIPLVFRLTGTLQRSHLHHSIQAIVQRHEILRTTFELNEGQLVQIVVPELWVPLPVTDLRAIIAETRETTALNQIWQEIQHPFDLAQGPLLRGRLWQLQDNEHWLLLVLHHIIFDEWSSGVFIRELGETYTALVTNTAIATSELPIQYADFACWQRQWLQGEVLDTQLRYWKRQLQDVPRLDLSWADRSWLPNQEQQYEGASQLLELPASLLNALEIFSQEAGVTLFMTLLAAFQTLLHRYTGQTDIAIGSPIANRHRSELEGLIGFLVNSLVLRTNLAGNPSFRELVERVREVTLAAYEHQDLPFEKLVEALQPVRNLDQNPLFQVVFALQNTPMSQLTLPDLTLSSVALETRTARFHLELYVWKCGDDFRNLWGEGWQQTDGLRGILIYNTHLFDRSTITALLQQFQVLLEGIIANPDTPLSALPLLTIADQQTLIRCWQKQNDDDPKNCIQYLFQLQAEQNPDAIAVQFADQTFTYQQLDQGSNQLARYLKRFGIQPGMPVGLCLERGIEAIAGMLAILKVGGAYVPLDVNDPPERLQFILQDAGITVVLTQTVWAESLSTGRTVICFDQVWEAIAHESNAPLPISGTADQLAYILYTSGSTGIPKGVLVPHRAVIRLVCATNYIHIEPGDRIAQVASLAFDAATFEIWGALLNGAQLIGIDRETTLSPTNFEATLKHHKIQILFLTTALLNQVIYQTPTAFQTLKYLLFGGERVNVARIRTLLHQGKPQHLIHVYGPTENTTFSTWYEVQTVSETATTVPIGQAITRTQVYVLDEQLQPVPAGVIGDLYLGGDGLAQGYLNRPALTAERFFEHSFDVQTLNERSRLYKTGDRVLYRADGNLEFVGRTDDQIKLRGFRIELGEVESAIAQHPAIQSVVVVVREVDQADQLVAYGVLRGTQQLTERALRSFLKTKLPIHMVPAIWVLLPALPLTPNGKVDRKALPLPTIPLPREQRTISPPTTSLEATLTDIWVHLLGRTEIGIHDNFFDLGGHSLLATQLVSRIRDRYQVELSLRQVFATPTIAELAHTITILQASSEQSKDTITEYSSEIYLEETQSQVKQSPGDNNQNLDKNPSILHSVSLLEVPETTTYNVSNIYSPLSFAQQRLWFLYQLAPNNPFYNVPIAMRLSGTLDTVALQRSLQEIVRRHQVLRTKFTQLEGQPVQIAVPKLDVDWTVINLQTVAEGDREQISQQLATEEAQRPFDLETHFPWRVTLLQLSATESVLILTLHHIVADGWSLGVLMREFACCYSAFVAGQLPQLPTLPWQYTDFAQWQRQWLQGERLEQQLNYWRNQLQNVPVLELPRDRPRPTVQTYRGATQPIHFSPTLTQALEQLSQESGTSLFMTLLAAWQTLLFRYTGQTDIAIGCPIANRQRSDWEGLIGFFVNSLVLRVDLSGNPPFRQVLAQVRTIALEAYDHQDVPFEKLVEVLDCDRDLSRNPLFQVAFALQNAPMQSFTLPTLTLEPFALQSISTRFDLEVHLWEPNHGLRSVWESQAGISGFIAYSTELFDPSRIARLIGHWQILLEGIVADPDMRLSDLPLLTATEHQQILNQWSRSPLASSHSGSTNPQVPLVKPHLEETPFLGFHQLVAAQARLRPAAIAVVTPQELLTYRVLIERVDRVAQRLVECGVRVNDLVGLCIDRSADWVVGILGILKAGAAFVPFDPSYPHERLHFMMTDTQISVLLTQSWLVTQLPTAPATVLCLDQSDRDVPILPDHQDHSVLPHHPAYVIYTSGSTGKPKGVLLTHGGLCNVVAAQQQMFSLSHQSRILQFSSISFDASIFEIALALGSGGSLYIPPSTAQLPSIALLQFLQAHRISHALLTPAVLAVLPDAKLPDLQVLITGGEACSSRIIDRWAGDRQFFNAYGPTEATIWATVAQLTPGDHPLTIGHPICNTQVYILDDCLHPVPCGIPGELYIGGAGLASGYLHRSDLTAEKFVANPVANTPPRLYRTGDRAQFREDGAIDFLGRLDNQIKLRGFRVELGEIEATLQAHPAIQSAVVVPIGDSIETQLVTYFSLDRQYGWNTILPILEAQHIERWQTLYNQTYQHNSPSQPIVCRQTISHEQPAPFDITGWQRSDTGTPIPLEHMQEWVRDRVQQILALKPRRVLEIGCGTGLLLFQIAPYCGQYIGTDFSAISLQAIEAHLERLNLPQVKLLQRVATDFTGLDLASFDVVILNSIVQYFPSQTYLIRVLEGALQRVTQGGVVFVGDVRSLPLLEAFHTWVQFNRAEESLERDQLRQQVERSLFEEPELVIDPAFFYQLRDRFPLIEQVQIRLTRGHHDNEMTQFRYNILLYMKEFDLYQQNLNLYTTFSKEIKHSENSLSLIQYHNWQTQPITPDQVKQYLIEHQPKIFVVTNVMNQRLESVIKVMLWLQDRKIPKTVGRMREQLQKVQSDDNRPSPQNWWDLECVLPYKIELTWSASRDMGSYDVWLIQQNCNINPLIEESHSSPIELTNQPLQSNLARQVIPELRQYLKQTLPNYMVPSTFIPLARVPLTVNGKVDRRLLPFMNTDINSVKELTDISLTATETALAEIWKDLLRIQIIRVHDNFFELGGHSLLATQMTSRVYDVLGLELPLKYVFEAPTIAQLAPIIDTLRTTATPTIPPITQLDRSAYRQVRSPLRSNQSERLQTAIPASRSPLIPLTIGKRQPPFFCVHPLFGVVFPYLELVQHLGNDRSFYGLQPFGIDGQTRPLNRVEAIAQAYLQAIQAVQPQGPYFLGGWSFGGLVAYEMAQQLTQAGQTVALLALLDTPAPCHPRSRYLSLKFLGKTVLRSLLPFLLDYGKLMGDRWQSRLLSRWQWSALTRLLPEESRLPLLAESAIQSLLPIVYANAQAAYHYVPQPYSHPITLFKAIEQPDVFEQDSSLGWHTLAHNIQLHEVPGNHLSLLKEPNVQILANQLRQYLA